MRQTQRWPPVVLHRLVRKSDCDTLMSTEATLMQPRRSGTTIRSAASRPPVLPPRMSGKRSGFRRGRLAHVTGSFYFPNKVI